MPAPGEEQTALPQPAGFVDGRWEPGDDTAFVTIDPATEQELVRYRFSSRNQVDAAVAAARRSFDAGVWRRRSPAERAESLRALADRIESDEEMFARLATSEVGTPITLSRSMHARVPVANLRWCADVAARGPRGGYVETLPPRPGGNGAHSVLHREPIGVVVAIVPYNGPLNLITWKLGPALAAGCSVVLLPSPRAALCATAFMRVVEDVGFPPGVVNMVLGAVDASQQLVTDPRVDLVSFTGSSAVGTTIMKLAADNLTKVVLELGGKSPNVVLPGTDLERVVAPSLQRFTTNAGQACGATTRIFVHRSQHDDFVARAEAVFDQGLRVGDPHDEGTSIGPVISHEHRTRVRGIVDDALSTGASQLAAGRAELPDAGWYLPPMIIGARNRDRIAQEELFAPVAVLMPYDDLDDAIARANDSRYALNAAVWGETDRAVGIAEQLVSGTVEVNGGAGGRPDVPWGGSKMSGIGVEMGEDGFSEFFSVKHVVQTAF